MKWQQQRRRLIQQSSVFHEQDFVLIYLFFFQRPNVVWGCVHVTKEPTNAITLSKVLNAQKKQMNVNNFLDETLSESIRLEALWWTADWKVSMSFSWIFNSRLKIAVHLFIWLTAGNCPANPIYGICCQQHLISICNLFALLIPTEQSLNNTLWCKDTHRMAYKEIDKGYQTTYALF